jgi:hypothetical protein
MVKRMESLGVDVSHLLVSEVGVFAMMNEVGVKYA